uniref:Uncharacterized protein n=1 Tax=Chromera velia CCMP2878 TaxID=1169474 RepID=A0A0G4I2R7_9ALVE|eukprot:Cvel_10482.t1-p1 / transcript=Cvel_10482.t1 / gene=Cvel_10482 / organism=Chromera_velia_CCMP2878 / gene_product=hypothetical protein / transcript_product=hypothetical protein / location=Cvel_scaffold632:69587-73437(-) / protein_length=556 / sequence_SO=supercontig / SO=protein_coding / is_pseudo=false
MQPCEDGQAGERVKATEEVQETAKAKPGAYVPPWKRRAVKHPIKYTMDQEEKYTFWTNAQGEKLLARADALRDRLLEVNRRLLPEGRGEYEETVEEGKAIYGGKRNKQEAKHKATWAAEEYSHVGLQREYIRLKSRQRYVEMWAACERARSLGVFELIEERLHNTASCLSLGASVADEERGASAWEAGRRRAEDGKSASSGLGGRPSGEERGKCGGEGNRFSSLCAEEEEEEGEKEEECGNTPQKSSSSVSSEPASRSPVRTQRRRFRVASLGGGPGFELVAFRDFLLSSSQLVSEDSSFSFGLSSTVRGGNQKNTETEAAQEEVVRMFSLDVEVGWENYAQALGANFRPWNSLDPQQCTGEYIRKLCRDTRERESEESDDFEEEYVDVLLVSAAMSDYMKSDFHVRMLEDLLRDSSSGGRGGAVAMLVNERHKTVRLLRTVQEMVGRSPESCGVRVLPLLSSATLQDKSEFSDKERGERAAERSEERSFPSSSHDDRQTVILSVEFAQRLETRAKEKRSWGTSGKEMETVLTFPNVPHQIEAHEFGSHRNRKTNT